MPEFSDYVEGLSPAPDASGTIYIPVSRNGSAARITPEQIADLAPAEHFLGVYADDTALTTAHATAEPGDYAFVDPGSGTDAQLYIWDEDEGWIASGVTTVVPDATEIVKGIVELATTAEAITGTDTERAVTPAGVKAVADLLFDALTSYRTVTGTHELDATDLANINAGKQLEIVCDSGSPLAIEIPTNATRAFPMGSIICGLQYGVGQVTVTPLSGVTLRSPNNANKTFAQYSKFYIEKVGTDNWVLSGDITV